jgi:glycosyltransferase involved in cell wall biosynthesis
MEEELKQLTLQLNLNSKVIFWGLRKDVPQLLAASDIFVLASIQREGLPISVLEAMGCQVPVIASRIGGLPEIIDDRKNGLLVPPNDPIVLAKAIEALILNPHKRFEYGKEGIIRFKEQFEAKLMIERIENLYQESLKNNG